MISRLTRIFFPKLKVQFSDDTQISISNISELAEYWWLIPAGRFDEVREFVTKHSLHSSALQHYPFGTDQYKTIGHMFAVLLKEKGNMEEAGVLFGQVTDMFFIDITWYWCDCE